MGAGVLWALVLLVWVGGGLHSFGEVAFFLVAAGAAGYAIGAAAPMVRRNQPLASGRRGTVCVVVFLTPLVFDYAAFIGWNSVKLIVVATGAAVVASLYVVELAGAGPYPSLRNRLWWPVLAFVGWVAVATVTSVTSVVSVFGHYDFFDGMALLVATVVLFFTVAADFEPSDVRALLSVIYLGSGSVVVFYGLEQLHDKITSWGGRWEWAYSTNAVHQANNISASRDIWATFGNPNHLAGYLAILLPIGIALFLLEKDRRLRLAVAVVGAAAVVELLQTTTRGALVAVAVSLFVVGIFLVPRTRISVRALLVAGAAVAAVVGIAVLLSFSGTSRYSVGQIAGGTGSAGSTTTARIEYWKTAARIARAHPVVGTGPDTFSNELEHAQSAKLVAASGPETVQDGPHNLLIEYLATLGIPGLTLFLVVLVGAAMLVLRSRRALTRRRDERWLVLTALTGALVAYVAQASFNVFQVSLAMMFWILLGALCVAAAQALAAPTDTTTRNGTRARRQRLSPTQGVVGAVALIVVIATLVVSSRPYRAAKALNSGVSWTAANRSAAQAGNAQQSEVYYGLALHNLQRAVSLDRSDPIFPESEAEFLLLAARPPSRSDDTTKLADYHRAEALLRGAIGHDPGVAREIAWLAAAIGDQFNITHTPSLLTEQIALLNRVIGLNPYAPEYGVYLGAVLFSQGRTQDALATVRRAEGYSPGNKSLLDAEHRIESGQAPATPQLVFFYAFRNAL